MQKLKKIPLLKRIILSLRRQGKTLVFTNGCFDILHPGHIKILRQAKSKGDILIVGLNSDFSLKRIKGCGRPILNEQARAQILSAISYVDYIVIFNEDTPYNLIKLIKPDYLVKGGDWKKEKIIGKEFAKKVFRVKLSSGYSSTGIINKIKSA
jgi:D-beta-D-heptose 7-phosphate kinase/D-beta-D-heptose 1-phosphate adenosyltransferase